MRSLATLAAALVFTFSSVVALPQESKNGITINGNVGTLNSFSIKKYVVIKNIYNKREVKVYNVIRPETPDEMVVRRYDEWLDAVKNADPDGQPESGLNTSDDVIGSLNTYPILASNRKATELRAKAWQLRFGALLSAYAILQPGSDLATWSSLISESYRESLNFAERAQDHVGKFAAIQTMATFSWSVGDSVTAETLFLDLRAAKKDVTGNAMRRHILAYTKPRKMSERELEAKVNKYLLILLGQYRVSESQYFLSKAMSSKDPREQLDHWNTMLFALDEAIKVFTETSETKYLAYALQRRAAMTLLNEHSSQAELMTAAIQAQEAMRLIELAPSRSERILRNRVSFKSSSFERFAVTNCRAQVLVRLCFRDDRGNLIPDSELRTQRLGKAVAIVKETLNFEHKNASSRDLSDALNNIGTALTLASDQNFYQAADAFAMAQVYRPQELTGVPVIDHARSMVGMDQIKARETEFLELSPEERANSVRNFRFALK